MLLSLLAAFAQLTLIVLAHELGHWFFAKISGVRVLGFNIGFGAKLWSVRRGGTEYALRCIPIGGYVWLADNSLGETDKAVPPDERFENKPWLARFGIMFGGALFNILLAWLVFYGLLVWRGGNFLTGVYKSLLVVWQILGEILRDIILIFSRGDFAALASPVGILRISANSIQQGSWPAFVLLTAFLSINLGVFNLLPLPALDGGRLLFLFYELIFRRKPNPRFEASAHLIGLIAFMTLLGVLFFLDISKL